MVSFELSLSGPVSASRVCRYSPKSDITRREMSAGDNLGQHHQDVYCMCLEAITGSIRGRLDGFLI
jgi:hypothetical protein